MTTQKYRELAAKLAQKVGSRFMIVYLIQLGITVILSLMTLLAQPALSSWQTRAIQYMKAGDTNLPPITREVQLTVLIISVISLLVRVINVGWLSTALRAARGEEYSWRDIPGFFPYLFKVFILDLLYRVGCILMGIFFVFPGIMLFYRWRLSYFVLADHPEYSPVQCMKQSARLMVGERMNLFRLDVSLLLPYGIALAVFWFSRGIVQLWNSPSIIITYIAFYQTMIHWTEPTEEEHE